MPEQDQQDTCVVLPELYDIEKLVERANGLASLETLAQAQVQM